MGNIKEAFGKQLKKVREERGLTQQVVADRMKTTVQTISSLERGKYWPSYETLEDLLMTLDAQPTELFAFKWPATKKAK